MTEQRICRAPDCDRMIDLERVRRYNATTCDPTCRARAWKAERSYGLPEARKARANGRPRRRRVELRVSYRKVVEIVAAQLARHGVVEPTGKSRLVAELWIADALTPRQRAALDSEREARA